MGETAEILIRSEDDLFSLLERVLADQRIAAEAARIKTSGWQPELLYLPDDPDGHTVAPSSAKAILEFHASLSRAYALLLYGHANARLLHGADKEILDLKILAIDGSNGLQILESALDRLVEGLVGQMSGEQTLIAILTFLVLFFSSSVARNWISEHYRQRAKQTDSDETLKLSEQETRRAELLTSALETAIKGRPELRALTDESDSSKLAVIRAVTRVDRARVMGTDITGEHARVIVAAPRVRGTGKKIDGEFIVIEMDNEPAEGYGGKVRNVGTNEEFVVDVNLDLLPPEDVDVLLFSLKEKVPILMQANAWLVDNVITRAAVVRASRKNG